MSMPASIRQTLLAALIAVPLAGSAGGASAAAVQKFDYLVQDFVAGGMTRTVSGDTVHLAYSYRDNGRGPDIDERWSFAGDGSVASYAAKGRTTFDASIDERFRQAQGRASWKTLSDTGEVATPAPLFYVPIQGTPETLAVLARALLAAPSGRLPLAPSGEASITRVETVTLAAGGPTRSVSLYAIAGLDLSPTYVWLDDGPGKDLFAALYPGPYGLIQQGYQAEAQRLAERQQAADGKLLADLQRSTRHVVDGMLAITNVRVFDSRKAVLGEPSTVYLYRGKVAAVLPAAQPVAKDATVVDGGGRALLPALIDVHGHESEWGAPLQVAGGVTIVRDVGNDNEQFLRLIQKGESGEYLTPRYLGRAGFLEGASPFASRGSALASSLEEARNWVDWYAMHGFRQIKIYNSFKPEWVEDTIRHAHSRGLRVSGHVPAFTRAELMVRAGYDELQHINQVFLNFLAGPKDDTRTLLRFKLVADQAHALDLDSAPVQEFLKLVAERGVAVDPTLATFEAMFRQDMGQPSPTHGKIADHLPITYQRFLRQAEMDATPEQRAVHRASYLKMLDMVRRMEAAGITVMPGTDGLPGFLLHRELELYVEAGIPAARVLQMATLDTARELGFDGFGAVETGMHADVILVDGDPTTDISAVRRIAMVTKGTDVYFPAEIYTALGVKPFVPAPALQRPR
jgi:imidazolonepropionase-like amidohydrolase